MGKILYQYDIKTPEPNFDVDKMISDVREGIPDYVVMQEKVEVKELYFGVKAAVVQLVVPEDIEGAQDKIENFLTELDSTGEWELSFTTRL